MQIFLQLPFWNSCKVSDIILQNDYQLYSSKAKQVWDDHVSFTVPLFNIMNPPFFPYQKDHIVLQTGVLNDKT